MKTCLALLTLALLTPAAATAEPTDSGISGVVRAAGCEPRDLGCPRLHPSMATIKIVKVASRAVVATVHPRDGRFRVRLPAGLYSLSLYGGTTTATKPIRTTRVQVEDGRFTVVVLTLPLRTTR